MSAIVNKGTGAGGANTTLNGSTFEAKTANEHRLAKQGFVRKGIERSNAINAFYYEKVISPTKSIIFMTKSGLRIYMEHVHKKKMIREPDEAYLLKDDNKYILKILEKKNQNTAGSVDTKLLAGIGFIEEYEYVLNENFEAPGEGAGMTTAETAEKAGGAATNYFLPAPAMPAPAKFTVRYAFCVSDFLKKEYTRDTPKSQALRHINKKYGIAMLFGDDANYFETLDTWISS